MAQLVVSWCIHFYGCDKYLLSINYQKIWKTIHLLRCQVLSISTPPYVDSWTMNSTVTSVWNLGISFEGKKKKNCHTVACDKSFKSLENHFYAFSLVFFCFRMDFSAIIEGFLRVLVCKKEKGKWSKTYSHQYCVL